MTERKETFSTLGRYDPKTITFEVDDEYKSQLPTGFPMTISLSGIRTEATRRLHEPATLKVQFKDISNANNPDRWSLQVLEVIPIEDDPAHP